MGGGSSPLFSSPSPRNLPRSRRGSSWAGLRFPGPAAFSSLPPAGAAPVLAGSSRPPHRGGMCTSAMLPANTAVAQSPVAGASPQARRGAAGRAGAGLAAPRVDGPGPPAPRPPFPSAGRSVHPPRCAQVRSAAGRRLRAGKGLGRASPRPRRRGRAEAARAGGGALATGFWAAGRREWDPLIFHAAQGLSYFFRIKRQTSTSPRGGGSPPALAASSPLGAAPSFGAQQLPLSRRVGSAVGFAALSPPEPPLPSAAAEHSERVSPHFPAPVSWRGWQRVTAEPTFCRAFPPGGGALRASSPNSQGTKPTDGHRGIPQPPALGRYNQRASAATRTRPGTSFLHGGIFFWW